MKSNAIGKYIIIGLAGVLVGFLLHVLVRYLFKF